MRGISFDIAHMLAGFLVLASFMMLYQDRLYALLNTLALHALVLALSVAWQAHIQDDQVGRSLFDQCPRFGHCAYAHRRDPAHFGLKRRIHGKVFLLGVLLDTVIVRTLLMPGVMYDIGDAIWWPSRLAAGQSESAFGATRERDVA